MRDATEMEMGLGSGHRSSATKQTTRVVKPPAQWRAHRLGPGVQVGLLPASDLNPTRPGFAPTRGADATGDIATLTATALGLNVTWHPWAHDKIPHRGTGTTLSQSLAIHTSATHRSRKVG